MTTWQYVEGLAHAAHQGLIPERWICVAPDAVRNAWMKNYVAFVSPILVLAVSSCALQRHSTAP